MNSVATSSKFPKFGALLAIPIAGLLAMFFFSQVQDIIVWTSPEQSIEWVAPITCPRGNLEFHPSSSADERDVTIHCQIPMPVGTRTDVTLQTIGYLTLLSYLACFLPLLLVLEAIVFSLPPMNQSQGEQKSRTEKTKKKK